MNEDIEELIERVADAASRVVEGEATEVALDDEIKMLRAAIPGLRTKREIERSWETTVDVPQLLGSHVKHLRLAAGWTQDQLAEAMTEMGFRWHRVTVSQTEVGERRRATLEELFALSGLFGQPLASFLVVPRGQGLDLNESRPALDGAVARDLVLGRGGRIGTGGPGWRAAATACAGVSARPATSKRGVR